MEFKDKVALIVGASSGIGRTLAMRLATEGAHVVVTARRKDKLDAQIVQRLGRIDLVMLNAGGAPALDMRAMGAREVTAYMRSNYDVAVSYLFPVLHQMVRLSLCLPKRLVTRILRNDVPPLPMERVGAPRAS